MTDSDVKSIIDNMLAHPQPDSLGVDAVTRALRQLNSVLDTNTPGWSDAVQSVVAAWNGRDKPSTDAEAGDQPGTAMQQFADMITTTDRQMGIGGKPDSVDWTAHRMSLGA